MTAVIVRFVFIVVLCNFMFVRTALACDVVAFPGAPTTPQQWVRAASVIVRSRAGTDHAVVPPPGSGGFGPDGTPLASIDFAILEVLKGEISDTQVRLPGFLIDRDTFHKYPGDSGPSCYSDFYKRGGEYLLLLFRQPSGAYSARGALAPLAEQLRGPDDTWLLFVRNELAKEQTP